MVGGEEERCHRYCVWIRNASHRLENQPAEAAAWLVARVEGPYDLCLYGIILYKMDPCLQ